MSSLLFRTTTPGFMSFGFSEMLIVGVVALLVFGGNLPDVMRTLGRSYAKLRQGLHELSRPVREEIQKVRDLPPSIDISQPDAPTLSEKPEGEESDEGPESDDEEVPADVYPYGDESEETGDTEPDRPTGVARGTHGIDEPPSV